ncbi:MAG: hypothetical protein IT256_05940 [Chitinophagaceae bacterium]|nr:hypothetical protein [Chitinophagaceae bacterium]
MNKTFFLLPIFIVVFLAGCKKKDANDNASSLAQYAQEVKIIPLQVMGNEATMSFVANNGQKDIVAKLQMKTLAAVDWKDVAFENPNKILINQLAFNTKYVFRVSLTRGVETQFSNYDTITTRNFSINYQRYFNGPDNIHDAQNGIFSIEGAKHIIYGAGFDNEQSILVKFASIDNSGNTFSVAAAILNDSMISFEMPRNAISNDPYLPQLVFSCMINDLPLIGYKSFLANEYLSKADMRIVNKDLHINSFLADGFGCKVINLYGYFGIHETETVTPENLYGVSMRIKERKLIVNDATGAEVAAYPLTPFGSTICNTDGITIADFVALSQAMIAYHEVTNITVKSSLPSGTYKAYVREVSKDDVVTVSNEVSLVF